MIMKTIGVAALRPQRLGASFPFTTQLNSTQLTANWLNKWLWWIFFKSNSMGSPTPKKTVFFFLLCMFFFRQKLNAIYNPFWLICICLFIFYVFPQTNVEGNITRNVVCLFLLCMFFLRQAFKAIYNLFWLICICFFVYFVCLFLCFSSEKHWRQYKRIVNRSTLGGVPRLYLRNMFVRQCPTNSFSTTNIVLCIS